MVLRSRKSGDESRSWKSGDESESAAWWNSVDVSESAYGRARQSFSIGAVEYTILGVVSVGCDGVGGIVKGGDDEIGEGGQHGSTAAAKFL